MLSKCGKQHNWLNAYCGVWLDIFLEKHGSTMDNVASMLHLKCI